MRFREVKGAARHRLDGGFRFRDQRDNGSVAGTRRGYGFFGLPAGRPDDRAAMSRRMRSGTNCGSYGFGTGPASHRWATALTARGAGPVRITSRPRRFARVHWARPKPSIAPG